MEPSLNAAETALEMDPGTCKHVASGPEGEAYYVRGQKKHVVLRSTALQLKASKKDMEEGVQTVATRVIWTTSVMDAKRLIDPVKYPTSPCTCTKCRAKQK